MTDQGIIVVGVDFKTAGDEAIRTALRRGMEVRGLVLAFVYAFELTNLPEEFGDEEFDTEEEALERAALLMQRRVEQIALASRTELDIRRTRIHPRIGKPLPVLLRACKDLDPELLIVGTNSRRGLDRLMVGSVAESLVRLAPCPVLVARPTAGRLTAIDPSYVGDR